MTKPNEELPFWRTHCGSFATGGFMGSSNDYILHAILTLHPKAIARIETGTLVHEGLLEVLHRCTCCWECKASHPPASFKAWDIPFFLNANLPSGTVELFDKKGDLVGRLEGFTR